MKTILAAFLLAIPCLAQIPGPLPVPFVGYFPLPDKDPSNCTPGLSPLIWRGDLKAFKYCSAIDTWAFLVSQPGGAINATSGTFSGPVTIGATVPTGAPANSLSVGGNVYGWPAVYIQPSAICGLGDSYISGKTGSGNTIWDSTWWNQLILKTGLLLVNNGGVQGQTTAQILSRVATDVIAWPCGTVIYDGGTNDVKGGVAFATTKANIIATVAQIQAASRRVVMATIAPQIGFNAGVTQINTWMHAYAASKGIPLVDIYALVTDPTTGNFKSGYSFDTIHPSPMACRLIAESALSAIQAMLPGWSPMAPQSNVDANNLLPNGLMLNISTDIPTGWTKQTASGNVTWSVAAATGINGNSLIMTKTATGSGADNDRTFYAITSGFSVGDRLAFTGKFLATGFESSSGGIAIDMFMYNAGFATQLDMAPVKSWVAADEPTAVQWYMEAVVPATVTQLVLTVGIFSTGTGVLKVGQVGVYNLTTMGAL